MAEEVKEQVQEQSQKGQSGRKRVAYLKTCMVVQQLKRRLSRRGMWGR